jgi:hypothetical protein
MKFKFTFTAAVLISLSFSANACDICGAGGGSGYLGLLPDFYKYIFSVRHRYNYLHTHLGADGNTTYLTTNEKYHITEIWGGWAITSKTRLMITVPYSINEKINQGVAKNKSGFSDISVSGFFQLLNKKKAIFKKKELTQTLWIGAGIKLPTGEYNAEDKSATNQTANLFQLGTASFDYLFTATYDARLQKSGINMSASYKINSCNKHKYRYGNKVNITTQVYHKLSIKKIALAPNAGFQFESSGKDADNGFKAALSGGKILSGTLGLETSINKIAVGANFQMPLSQQLANGFVKASNRMMMHLSFAL